MKKPRIKICCISSAQEALDAIAFGASAVGLVGKMPSGPGVILDEQIRQIVRIVPPPIATFLLTSETKATDIIAHHQRIHTNTLQLVDEPEPNTYQRLRESLLTVKLVQVIHVIDESSIDEALRTAEHVDALLLDSGNPKLAVKELGGTGRVHDWALSRRICESVAKPVFLAGGLNADNVQRAIEMVQPFGLDLCSSVRTDGKLDLYKLERFFEAVQNV